MRNRGWRGLGGGRGGERGGGQGLDWRGEAGEAVKWYMVGGIWGSKGREKLSPHLPPPLPL